MAVLVTNGPHGYPHPVPCCFGLDGGTLYSLVDDKPKSSAHLRRLDNIAADARVTVLAQHYVETWDELWWIRTSGTARVASSDAEHDHAVALLLRKYGQYVTHRLDGPAIAVTLASWRTWAAR